ncbi:Uncharacterized protein OBRU01_01977, partial [Operophtera brumata]
MEDNIVNDVIVLYEQKKWKEIGEKFHDHPDRNKLLWVFPSEKDFQFLAGCVKELRCERMLSIGCGSGLLEWMFTEATGYPVAGVEVDNAWWHYKYAPPMFIPLLFTYPQLGNDVIHALHDTSTALLFCYFNNRPAFNDYLEHFKGNVIVIIGPGDGKHVHTDPKPFNDVSNEWELFMSQEVRNSGDFIA